MLAASLTNCPSPPTDVISGSAWTVLAPAARSTSRLARRAFSSTSGQRQNLQLALTAIALAALPGQTDSVVVQTSTSIFNAYLNIYDAGVLRGTDLSLNNYASGNYALAVDGTRGEIYAGAGYNTYTYGTSGAVLKAISTTSATYANYATDEIQIVNGPLYTGQGKVFDAESCPLMGTFYSSGTTVAGRTAIADFTLGKVFFVDSPANNSGISGANQIPIFDISDFNSSTSSVIPISISYGTSYSSYANRLTRWGANGLALRTPVGIYSLRSNLVKYLSTTTPATQLGVFPIPQCPASPASKAWLETIPCKATSSLQTRTALTTVPPRTASRHSTPTFSCSHPPPLFLSPRLKAALATASTTLFAGVRMGSPS
jgi:hypothetical protein